MSLRAIFTKEKMQDIKSLMPERFIVYKVVSNEIYVRFGVRFARYVAPICRFTYLDGEQTVRQHLGCFPTPVVDNHNMYLDYYPGFHSFVKKSVAFEYMKQSSTNMPSLVVLSCGMDKEWITAIGLEGDRNMVVVSNRIIIPTYPTTDIQNDNNYLSFFELDEVPKLRKEMLRS